jgi:tetraacyldisaccharide 4'-kinase
MELRAPSFWWQAPGLVANLLMSPAFLYGEIAGRRMGSRGIRLPIPVICVGNFVIGGAGKTPTAIALAKRLVAERVYFLARGYRSAAGRRPPLRVDPMRHNAAQVGDEALLLAEVAPTIVSSQRVAAARLAIAQGASLLILDDGLQNPALEKNLRLAVVDAAAGVGNGLCLPAGPLRVPLAAQIDFISAAIIVGEGAAGSKIATAARAAGKPVLNAELVPDPAVAAKLRGQRVYAFAGIAHPEKFYAALGGLGAEIAGTAAFPDHHLYRRREIVGLQRAARQQDALLLTTQKDLVRLAGENLADPAFPPPIALPVEMRFSDSQLLDELLGGVLHHEAWSRPICRA